MHSESRRRYLNAIGSAAVLSTMPVASLRAQAQGYPQRPVRVIVPFPPGGGTDVIARIAQPRIAEALGGQLIIDNRGGAGGSIGTDVVAKSPPDGYTLLFTLSSHTINAAIFSKLSFNTETDFAPVSLVASLPQILVAHPDVPVRTPQDVVALARAKPGTVLYASVGNGTPGHLAGEMMALAGNVRMVHVPYRGGGPAVTDVLANQIGLLWVSIPAAAAHVKSGKLRPIAVSTLKRAAGFPDVPTMAESGFPGFEVDSWYAMFAPAKTPPAIIDRLHKAAVFACAQADVREKFMQQGAEAVGSTPAELDRIVKAEIPKWTKLAREAGIKAD
jgi:tripartite-type tricarboxylate transporter receptor subunit TctC